jgi:N-methylhydantoinase A/oxoprolinase/acetone carboxylase beta subunit
MTEGNKSEVARLMRQIEQEYEAAQRGLYGFAAGTGKHEFINARVENIGRYHEKLKTLVGEQEAVKALAQALEQAGNETTPEKEAAQ